MSFFTELEKCETLAECQTLFNYELDNLKSKTIYKNNPDKLDKRMKQILYDIDEHMSNHNIEGYIVIPTVDDESSGFDFKNINVYKQLFYWLSPMVIAFGLILIVGSIFKINNVSGHSMDPTLKDSTYLVSNKFSQLKRFNMVVAQELDKNGKPYGVVKRIIGMPGDKLEYKHDVLYINGVEVSEPYLDDYLNKFKSGELESEYTYDDNMKLRAKTSPSFTTQDNDSATGEPNEDISTFKVEVPTTGYFLMGDNRLVSKDSRQVGAFPRENIVGKVVLSNLGK